MVKFWLQCVYVTLFVFFMMWGVSIISDFKLFSAFDPISQALSDFEMTDYAFSNLRPDPLVDQRIVIVNFAPSRREIAQEIQLINSHKPKVIGIDGFFNCEGGLRDTVNCPQLLDTLGNLMLSNAIQEAKNVVLVTRLMQRDSTFKSNTIDVYDSIEYSDPMFSNYATNAYANLPTGADYQEDVKQCRSLFPKIKVGNHDELAFSVAVAKKFDSLKAKKFLDRNNDEEIINFKGNVEVQDVRLKNLEGKDLGTTRYPIMFYALDWDQLLNGEYIPEMFNNSIVMMGSLGNKIGDKTWEDKFFTPLNKKVAGRANPDMFGLVVHANAVAMILNEDYVNELVDWEKYAIAIILCILNVALFIVIDEKLPVWFDALSVLIQVFQILLISGLVVYYFATFTFKLDLSIALAVSALVGPCYDIFKSVQREIENRLTKRRERVLTQKN